MAVRWWDINTELALGAAKLGAIVRVGTCVGVGVRGETRLGFLDPGSGQEPEPDLESFLEATPQGRQHVLGDAADDKFGVGGVGIKDAGEHALADEWGVGLGEVIGVDGVITLVGEKLGAAVGDALDAHLQVDDANLAVLINGDGLDVQRLRIAGQVVGLGIPIDGVADFYCGEENGQPRPLARLARQILGL